MIRTKQLPYLLAIFALIALCTSSCKVALIKSTYQYSGLPYVKYKSGETIYPKGSVKVVDNRRMVDNKNVFMSTDVIAWSDGLRNFKRVNKKMLAFQTDSGKVNLYCRHISAYVYSHSPGSSGWSNASENAWFIETAPGTFKELRYKPLRAAIPETAPGSEALKKYKKVNTTHLVFTYGGAALLVGGLMLASEKGTLFNYQFGEHPLNGRQIAGWGCAVAGGVAIPIGVRIKRNNFNRLLNAARLCNAQ